MSPFDFEAFISGVTVDLPREQVPIYAVVHQAKIDDLNEQIEAASDPDAPGADERESSSGASALVKERDRLIAEQDESAKWITLRCLTTQEFADSVQAKDATIVDQLAAQTRGTDNEMSRDDFQRLREVIQPAAWSLMVENANRIVGQQLVMPDFSPTTSASRSTPES